MTQPFIAPIKSASPPVNPPQPVFKRRWWSSLSSRILLAMVVVSFLSAIIGGVLYQVQVSETIRQLDQHNRDDLIARIEYSRLGPRVTEQVKEAIESSRRLQVASRPVVNFALDYSIWIVVATALVASLLAFGLGWVLTRRIVGPLEKLLRASQQVAAGDFSQRVAVGNQDEIGQVAYSFNLMATELQGAEAKRRELLGDVAHELKTPLASIQGHVEALRDNLPRARANPDAIFEIVLEDVSELNRMIGSLRSWLNAQGTLEDLKPQPLALSEELTALIERFRPRAEAEQVRLELQLEPGTTKILADRNSLRQMLSNLLDNALRYTPAGGQVRLLAWAGESPQPGVKSTRADGRITLAVADTGCGIDPEHWPHLFERFYRVDKSRTRDTGGTGLGLALVRDLAQAQQGRVWLNSQVGGGTIFYISLPAA